MLEKNKETLREKKKKEHQQDSS